DRSCYAVELRLRVERRRNLVQSVGHQANPRLIDLTDRSVFKLWDEVARDLALVRANGADRTLLTTAVRLRSYYPKPAFRVLGESDRACFLCCNFCSAAH